MNLLSETFWYNDGSDISKNATTHCPSNFGCSPRYFAHELSVLFEKNCADTLETKNTVND